MTVTINGSTGIDKVAAGAIEKADLPAGTVLQVVNATYSTATSSSSSTYSDTGLTASITPTSATSKIAIFTQQNGYRTGSNTSIDTKLVRNSTDLADLTTIGDTSSTSTGTGAFSYAYVDSPATTSSVTYKVQFRNRNAVGTVTVQSNGSKASIVLMEIAA